MQSWICSSELVILQVNIWHGFRSLVDDWHLYHDTFIRGIMTRFFHSILERFDCCIRWYDSILWTVMCLYYVRFCDSIIWWDSLIRFFHSIYWIDSLKRSLNASTRFFACTSFSFYFIHSFPFLRARARARASTPGINYLIRLFNSILWFDSLMRFIDQCE